MPRRKGRRAGRGEGSKPRPRKGGSRSAAPALFTIAEEDDEGQRWRNGTGSKAKASFYKADDGRVSSSPTRPSSSLSGQVYSPTPSATGSSINNNRVAPRIDSSLFNKTDERLRLARERREEREKQNAAKEAQWQAREERARQHYEKHLEERRRKLEEQRIKEEQRRLAVEEKRRQKLEEDKVRHEAVMRRTMERAQASRPKHNRWSWGGPLHPTSPITPTGFVESARLFPFDLAGLEHVPSAFSVHSGHRMRSQYADRRSVSTVNLSKQHDAVISKRLSSSSATLLHSPDRGPRRLPLTLWESNMVNRLQQPTHSYLARSRSAMSLSGEHAAMPVCPRSVSCHPMGSMSFKTLQARPLSHSRSHDRSLSRETASSVAARRRTTGTLTTPQKNRDSVRKSWSNLSLPLGPSLTLPLKLRSSSPVKRNAKVAVLSPGRPPQRVTGRPPTPKMLKSPAAEDPGNLRPIQVSPEIPQPPAPGKTQEAEDEPVLSPPPPAEQSKTAQTTRTAPSDAAPKPSAGTTDREEASRILAENRRLVREQREREEEEQRQQEEQARLAKEEMARRKAEERARREEEAQRQADERRLKEEEETRMAEERLQQEREEAERVQKQREEEESRQKEETERLRQEREKHFQKEEAERLERKKRLEEIMKRTRRSDTADKKESPSKNTDGPVDAASPGPSRGNPAPHSNGCQADSNLNADTSTHNPLIQRENGAFEEALEPPSHSRLKEDEQRQEDERVDVMVFRENGFPKPLSAGVDDITVQQGADVA
ncbi:ensconsin isoform X3 [Hippocampus zosterae]|uniref:ensconsin isoform X3 n=1 Tax=Hippocampus zosterae TaxID=109293 RepID=UPI00223E70E2|nr:ensconsin isoform X3 [Hippocampus zosterae]